MERTGMRGSRVSKGFVDNMNERGILVEFVKKINEHDVKGIASLLSEGHLFVDSLGNRVRGRGKMVEGWKAYLSLFPDYKISISEIFRRGSSFALFGTAQGTYVVNGGLVKKNRWKVPAAWKAIAKDDHIVEWRVFGDNYKTASLLKGQ